MKTGAKIAAAAIVLAVLGWTGVVLYWHLTIRSAIQYFDDHASDVSRPRVGLPEPALSRPGDRGVQHPEYQRGLSMLVFFAVTKVNAPEAVAKLQQVALLSADDEPADHKRKIDAIRIWWDQHGRLYHRWRRVWSSKCVP
jgi:hypothetical protein